MCDTWVFAIFIVNFYFLKLFTLYLSLNMKRQTDDIEEDVTGVLT